MAREVCMPSKSTLAAVIAVVILSYEKPGWDLSVGAPLSFDVDLTSVILSLPTRFDQATRYWAFDIEWVSNSVKTWLSLKAHETIVYTTAGEELIVTAAVVFERPSPDSFTKYMVLIKLECLVLSYNRIRGVDGRNLPRLSQARTISASDISSMRWSTEEETNALHLQYFETAKGGWLLPEAYIGDSYYEHLQALEEMLQEVGASSSPALQP